MDGLGAHACPIMSETATPSFAVEDLINPQIPISIPKDSVNDYPLRRYEGAVAIINEDAQLDAALAEISRESVLGFDTESRPVFKRGDNYPPALLQLAGAEKVWLFQLQRLTELDKLFAVLADASKIKAGVAIRDDIKKLNEVFPFQAESFLELSDFTQKAGIVNTGLRSLAAIFLHYRVSKGAQVSNWSRAQLTTAQIQYAATDAWVSRQLFLRLQEVGLIPADCLRPAAMKKRRRRQ